MCKSESYIPVSASPPHILGNLTQHLQVILVLELYVEAHIMLMISLLASVL